jgi:cobaltochelatase CobN
MFGGLTVSNNKLDAQLGNQLAGTLLGMTGSINGATTSAGYQTSLAWMMYLANQGTWAADSATLQKLADEYMKQVIEYGVACCHHTCKNLAFNSKIIQMSSLTPAEKQKFADILAQATNTDPLYQMDELQDNQGSESNQGGSGNGQTGNDANNAQQLANGTSNDRSSSSDSGQTSAGEDASQTGDAKSASDLQSSSSSASEGSAGDSGAKSYELSEKSAAKSMTAAESSMPIFVVIAVIILIAIFLVGYWRNDENDYDDY